MEHKEPVEGNTCACCWDDICQSNYVEYRSHESGDWLSSGYCQSCLQHLIQTQWQVYISSLEKSTCRAEMKRLLGRGPPINLRDPKALPCPNDGEVFEVWFMSDGAIHSAKLDGSLLGEDRDIFWREKLEFFPEEESDDPDRLP